MTRQEHIRALMEEYAQQRARNDEDLEERTSEACAAAPDIARLKRESASLALDAMRSILTEQTQAERETIARNMKARGLAINAEIRDLIKAAGLPEDILDMKYRCDKCRDTGYVGEAPARFCECFEKRLRLRMFEDGSMAGTDEQNFDRFDEHLIPVEDGQRTRTKSCRDACLQYADSFPKCPRNNLLMTGEGGTGKTFLLNCVFERVTSRGFSAVRITAFRMFETMRQQHLGQDAGYRGFTDLIEAPLLLIDDLGAEPMMRNITVEYLFTLLNERQAAKRHTVIATNLSPAKLRERYGERVSSRLLDKSAWMPLRFEGKDLRSQ